MAERKHVCIEDTTHNKLSALAKKEGKVLQHLADELINEALEARQRVDKKKPE